MDWRDSAAGKAWQVEFDVVLRPPTSSTGVTVFPPFAYGVSTVEPIQLECAKTLGIRVKEAEEKHSKAHAACSPALADIKSSITSTFSSWCSLVRVL